MFQCGCTQLLELTALYVSKVDFSSSVGQLRAAERAHPPAHRHKLPLSAARSQLSLSSLQFT